MAEWTGDDRAVRGEPREGDGAGRHGGDRDRAPRGRGPRTGDDRGRGRDERTSRGERDRTGGPRSRTGGAGDRGLGDRGAGARGDAPRGRTSPGGAHRGREARAPRPVEPPLPEDVTGKELDADVRRDLSGLSGENATAVARHLVQVARLLDDDPALALEHARAAQRRAGRVGAVREATGLAAYRAGEYEEALRELRTARRITGSQEHLPVMADCERGLGRPERALDAAAGPAADALDRAGRIELAIVVAGARRDLGQADAAVLELRLPELTASVPPGLRESQARLQEAYDDALAAAGRPVPRRGRGGAAGPQVAEGGVADEDDDVLLWEEEA